jgi:hypothetical protein
MSGVRSKLLNVVSHDTPALAGFNRPDRKALRSTLCVEIS